MGPDFLASIRAKRKVEKAEDGQEPEVVVKEEDPKAASEEEKSRSVPLKESATYGKYFKMVKFGTPRPAVEQKMREAGLDPAILDEPADAPLRRDWTARGVVQKQEPAWKKAKTAPRKTRAFFWEATKEASGVWLEVDSTTVEVDDDRLRETFAVPPPKKVTGGASSSSSSSKKSVFGLDGKVQQNVEIALSQFKDGDRSWTEVVDAVVAAIADVDEDVLAADKVSILARGMPSAEMETKIRSWIKTKGRREDSDSDLNKAETFYRRLLAKVADPSGLLKCLRIKTEFKEACDGVKKGLTAIDIATRQVEQSTALRIVLAHALRFGNALNRGTRLGDMRGFRLHDLVKLDDVKSRDGTTTGMGWLVETLEDTDPAVLDSLGRSLADVAAASKISFPQLDADLEHLRADTAFVDRQTDARLAEEGDAYVTFGEKMVVFRVSADEMLGELGARYAKCAHAFGQLVEFLGEDKTCDVSDLFSTVDVVVKTIDANRRKLDDRRRKDQLRRQKELQRQKARERQQSMLQILRDLDQQHVPIDATTLAKTLLPPVRPSPVDESPVAVFRGPGCTVLAALPPVKDRAVTASTDDETLSQLSISTVCDTPIYDTPKSSRSSFCALPSSKPSPAPSVDDASFSEECSLSSRLPQVVTSDTTKVSKPHSISEPPKNVPRWSPPTAERGRKMPPVARQRDSKNGSSSKFKRADSWIRNPSKTSPGTQTSVPKPAEPSPPAQSPVPKAPEPSPAPGWPAPKSTDDEVAAVPGALLAKVLRLNEKRRAKAEAKKKTVKASAA